MTAGSFAKARTEDLIVQEMGEETLVFDRRTDVAHCLTPAATIVWRMCDGETGRELMVAAVATVAPANAEATVEAALADLSEKDLLVAGVSRRAALGKMAKYGVGAVTVPLVLSVTAPVALAGASNANGTPCTPTPAGSNTDPNCKSGLCGLPPTSPSSGNRCGACINTGPVTDSIAIATDGKGAAGKSVSCCGTGTSNCTRDNNGVGNTNGSCVFP
jgi:hypothetical protein